MRPIYNTWNCWKIVSNDRYIATLGSGITILDHTTHNILHHFTQIRNIHGALFLNEDVLAVYTGAQKLYFFQISEKKLLWQCPRPKQLATSGDMRCIQVPGTNKIACIAAGKEGLNDYFYLLVDYGLQTIHFRKIPNCYRVVHSLSWTQDIGLTFLSYQAKGDGKLLYRIAGIEDGESFPVFLEWEDFQDVNAYSGNYLFLNNHSTNKPCLSVCKIVKTQQPHKLSLEHMLRLTVPTFQLKNPVCSNEYLPLISWIDETTRLLTIRTDCWMGVYNFGDNTLISECSQRNISCGVVINGKILIGCSPGLWVCDF